MIGTSREVIVAERGGVFAFVALLAALTASVLVLSFGPALPAQAQQGAANTITVDSAQDTNTSGDGDCTLREAINNADSDGDTTGGDCAAGGSTGENAIVFDLGSSATITLGSTLPTITDGDGLSIDAEGNEITVSGNGAVRVLRVNSGAELALKDLTVANGRADDDFGGGIYNTGGTLTATNSTFSGNSAVFGGGITNDDGTFTATDSTFSQNSASFNGGGIANYGGTLSATGSTFSGNSAVRFGGGIANFDGGALTATNSTFSGNNADFGGGGIANFGGTLAATNATFSQNSADSGGGGVANFDFGGPATLRNTVVANSASGASCRGTITDGGGNLDDGSSCGFSAPSSQSEADDGLDPAGLQDNGGPTRTIALLPESDAVDAGVEATCAAPPVNNLDQRGTSRPRDGDGDGTAECDSGSFELQRDFDRVQFGDATHAANEGATTATITVTRTGGAGGEVGVDYRTSDGTATAGSDYAPTSGTLVFADGETTETFEVAIADDAWDEPDETVNLALSDARGEATLGEPDEATLAIRDDDEAPPAPRPACSDGRDNDGDGRVDLRDPGCDNRRDDSEREPRPAPEPDPGPANECTIRGNNRDNTIRGTAKRDVICARGGGDTIRGLGGNDLILGGGGEDTIQGNAGDDTVRGGNGEDTIQGNDGRDRLYGDGGADTVQGGSGKDTVRGGAGDDTTQQ